MSQEQILSMREEMRDQERRRNREAAPNLAALVDELRAQFPDAKLVWGKDLLTDVEIGKRPDEPNSFQIPSGYEPCKVIETRKSKERR